MAAKESTQTCDRITREGGYQHSMACVRSMHGLVTGTPARENGDAVDGDEVATYTIVVTACLKNVNGPYMMHA